MKNIYTVLKLRNIHKSFGKSEVLKGISLDQGDIREQGPPEKGIDNPDSHQCRKFLAKDLPGDKNRDQ